MAFLVSWSDLSRPDLKNRGIEACVCVCVCVCVWGCVCARARERVLNPVHQKECVLSGAAR